MPTDNRNDKAFNDYLKGDSDLSRRYRDSARPEPPEHLDDVIIAAGRDVLKKPGRKVVRLLPRTWYKPVSMAALVVVCVSLVFTLYDSTGTRQQYMETPGIDASPEQKLDNRFRSTEMADEILRDKKSVTTMPAESATDLLEDQTPSLDSDKTAAGIIRMEDVRTAKEIQEETGAESSATFEADRLESRQRAPAAVLRREIIMQDAAESDPVNKPIMDGKTETDWLEEINELWQAGKKQEAVVSLEKFLESYPDYSREDIVKQLPDDFDLPEKLHN